MSIRLDTEKLTAELNSGTISYVMEAVDGRYLVHRYFGPALRRWNGCGAPVYYKRAYSTAHACSIPNVSFDDFPFEYPVRGRGDFRIPALEVRQQSGIRIVEPLFRSWRVLEGVQKLPGLPAVRGEDGKADTLEVICEDAQAGLRVRLYYTVFEGMGIMLRYQEFENTGSQILVLENVQSVSLELPARPYDFLTLYGTHAREGCQSRSSLHHGIQRIESLRGSSSPQHQPFLALMSPETAEDAGEVYAMHLIYSGNFLAQAEMDSFGNVRGQIGIHPEGFAWKLKPGERFVTPQAVLNYSKCGLNGMSGQFHNLYREHLMPPRFVGRERPILLNSWESMYYDVSLEKIEEQTELAGKLGIELFVLDDGWFREDNSSSTSMGDWQCNKLKLPGGIPQAARLVHEKGLQFGLWFEPEAVGKTSALYRMHPEWCLQIPGCQPVEGRREYLLDLTRREVREYLISMLDSYLEDGLIDYVKWDMNRPLTDINSLLLDAGQKGETAHRYILGLYEILEHITTAYPYVLIEGCSSGGARFDPGMLYYVGQNWASDNTDGFDRMEIQDGLSLLYPPVAMGAHVSITPNHQTGRSTPLNTRYRVAELFNLGYELDLTKCSEKELAQIASQIQEYRQERKWLQNAAFYHHREPSKNYLMWSAVSTDKRLCRTVIFQKFYNPLYCHGNFRLTGLDPEADYQEVGSGRIYGGDELMEMGLSLPLVKEDFHGFSFLFRQVEKEQR